MSKLKKRNIENKTEQALKELNDLIEPEKTPPTRVIQHGTTNIIAADSDINISDSPQLQKEIIYLKQIIASKDEIIASKDAYIKLLSKKNK